MEKQLNEFSMDPGESLALFRIEMDRRLRQLTTKRLKLAKEHAEQRAAIMNNEQWAWNNINYCFNRF